MINRSINEDYIYIMLEKRSAKCIYIRETQDTRMLLERRIERGDKRFVVVLLRRSPRVTSREQWKEGRKERKKERRRWRGEARRDTKRRFLRGREEKPGLGNTVPATKELTVFCPRYPPLWNYILWQRIRRVYRFTTTHLRHLVSSRLVLLLLFIPASSSSPAFLPSFLPSKLVPSFYCSNYTRFPVFSNISMEGFSIWNLDIRWMQDS